LVALGIEASSDAQEFLFFLFFHEVLAQEASVGFVASKGTSSFTRGISSSPSRSHTKAGTC
jgi:hypothetical protein